MKLIPASFVIQALTLSVSKLNEIITAQGYPIVKAECMGMDTNMIITYACSCVNKFDSEDLIYIRYSISIDPVTWRPVWQLR